MFKKKPGQTGVENQLRDNRWRPAGRENAGAGLQLIMEHEGAEFFMPSPNGAGTFIRLKDGSTRLVGPEELREKSIYGARLEEVWKTFQFEFEDMAKKQYREKTTRLTRSADRMRLSGCYFVKLPPDYKDEERREVTLTIEFRLSEAAIVCSCDCEQIWQGKTLRVSSGPSEYPLIEGEQVLDERRAAQELLDEFTRRLEPCRSH